MSCVSLEAYSTISDAILSSTRYAQHCLARGDRRSNNTPRGGGYTSSPQHNHAASVFSKHLTALARKATDAGGNKGAGVEDGEEGLPCGDECSGQAEEHSPVAALLNVAAAILQVLQTSLWLRSVSLGTVAAIVKKAKSPGSSAGSARKQQRNASPANAFHGEDPLEAASKRLGEDCAEVLLGWMQTLWQQQSHNGGADIGMFKGTDSDIKDDDSHTCSSFVSFPTLFSLLGCFRGPGSEESHVQALFRWAAVEDASIHSLFTPGTPIGDHLAATFPSSRSDGDDAAQTGKAPRKSRTQSGSPHRNPKRSRSAQPHDPSSPTTTTTGAEAVLSSFVGATEEPFTLATCIGRRGLLVQACAEVLLSSSLQHPSAASSTARTTGLLKDDFLFFPTQEQQPASRASTSKQDNKLQSMPLDDEDFLSLCVHALHRFALFLYSLIFAPADGCGDGGECGILLQPALSLSNASSRDTTSSTSFSVTRTTTIQLQKSIALFAFDQHLPNMNASVDGGVSEVEASSNNAPPVDVWDLLSSLHCLALSGENPGPAVFVAACEALENIICDIVVSAKELQLVLADHRLGRPLLSHLRRVAFGAAAPRWEQAARDALVTFFARGNNASRRVMDHGTIEHHIWWAVQSLGQRQSSRAGCGGSDPTHISGLWVSSEERRARANSRSGDDITTKEEKKVEATRKQPLQQPLGACLVGSGIAIGSPFGARSTTSLALGAGTHGATKWPYERYNSPQYAQWRPKSFLLDLLRQCDAIEYASIFREPLPPTTVMTYNGAELGPYATVVRTPMSLSVIRAAIEAGSGSTGGTGVANSPANTTYPSAPSSPPPLSGASSGQLVPPLWQPTTATNNNSVTASTDPNYSSHGNGGLAGVPFPITTVAALVQALWLIATDCVAFNAPEGPFPDRARRFVLLCVAAIDSSLAV